MISLYAKALLIIDLILLLVVCMISLIKKNRVSKFLFHTHTIIITSLFALLIYAFIFSYFSIKTVFLSSSVILPLIYKIAASWSSNEGSMMLWILLVSIFSSLYILIEKKNKYQNINHFIFIVSIILLIFITGICFFNNPFSSQNISVDNRSFSEGLGLNPLLQDIGLVIHPPILYLGYSCYFVIFAIANSYLLGKKLDTAILKNILIFSNIGLIALSTGIGLGSWWAYRELGWGGFWFFDPVENIALLPWLTAVALHHSLHLSIKQSVLIKEAILLSIITFLFTLFSVFLVRSGLLISVHSFAKTANILGTYLLSSIFVIAVFAIGLYIKNAKNLIQENIKTYSSFMISVANYLWLFIAIIILFSCLYPIFYSLYFKSNITLEAKFFYKTFIPMIIATVALNAVSHNSKTHIASLALSVMIGLYYFYTINNSFINFFAITSSCFLIINNIVLIFKKKHRKIAMIVAHIGYGMLALTITLVVSLQKEYHFSGNVGSHAKFENFNIKLVNIKYDKIDNYYRQIAEFWLEANNETIILKPENRLYIVENAMTPESSIYSCMKYDLYSVISRINKGEVEAVFYYRPCINIMWLALMIMIGGIFIGFSSRND